MRSKSQILSKLRADGHITDEEYKALDQEPSEDAISRQQALKELKESAEHHANDSREEVLLRRDRDIIRALPPVTPQPKIGRWIAYEVRLPDRTILNYRCSVCGRKLIGYNTETLSEAPFCHCGARMVEKQEGSEE